MIIENLITRMSEIELELAVVKDRLAALEGTPPITTQSTSTKTAEVTDVVGKPQPTTAPTPKGPATSTTSKTATK